MHAIACKYSYCNAIASAVEIWIGNVAPTCVSAEPYVDNKKYVLNDLQSVFATNVHLPAATSNEHLSLRDNQRSLRIATPSLQVLSTPYVVILSKGIGATKYFLFVLGILGYPRVSSRLVNIFKLRRTGTKARSPRSGRWGRLPRIVCPNISMRMSSEASLRVPSSDVGGKRMITHGAGFATVINHVLCFRLCPSASILPLLYLVLPLFRVCRVLALDVNILVESDTSNPTIKGKCDTGDDMVDAGSIQQVWLILSSSSSSSVQSEVKVESDGVNDVCVSASRRWFRKTTAPHPRKCATRGGAP